LCDGVSGGMTNSGKTSKSTRQVANLPVRTFLQAQGVLRQRSDPVAFEAPDEIGHVRCLCWRRQPNEGESVSVAIIDAAYDARSYSLNDSVR